MDNQPINAQIPIVFDKTIPYNTHIQQARGYIMKKILIASIMAITTICTANAYQVMSSKELGKNDAKNQNVVVKCTTDMGRVSNQTCSLRRYAKCTGNGSNKRCSGWQPWRDLRSPSTEYASWQAAASACCRAKGLR
jgi:hypothetical protein